MFRIAVRQSIPSYFGLSSPFSKFISDSNEESDESDNNEDWRKNNGYGDPYKQT